MELDPAVIKARREDIQQAAPCEGCGASLEFCESQRGKNPTAPSWFGCCARGAYLMGPCAHRPDQAALCDLLKEIESGHVRSVEEVLLDSVTEFSSRRYPSRLAQVLAGWSDPQTDYYGD